MSGEVLFEEGARPFYGATVYIRLENNSQLDAASQVIAEQVVRNFSYQPGESAGLEFKLYGEQPDEHASCNVRAHVDLNGDSRISAGDYITMQSYPVLTYGYPRRISITVREVR